MRFKQKIKNLVAKWQTWPLYRRILVVLGSFVLIAAVLSIAIPKTVEFSYGGRNCTRQLMLLPGVMKQKNHAGYDVTFEHELKIGTLALASFGVCFTPTMPPQSGEKTVALSPFGGGITLKRFVVKVNPPAIADVTGFVGQTVPVTRPIVISLDQPDDTFHYMLGIGKSATDCTHQDGRLSCDITGLDLAQGKTYEGSLRRDFRGQGTETLGGGTFTTLKALKLKKASVKKNQTVYSKPKSLSFEYDKTLVKATAKLAIRDDGKWKPVEAGVVTDGKKVVVSPAANLKREAEFKLTIEQAEGQDGSALADPYVVEFKTSGGPKVTSINIGSTGAALAGTIVMRLDQAAADATAAAKLVAVKGLKASVSVSGSQIFVTYTAGRCADFSLTVKKGLKSKAGITQEKDWSFSSRTQCYSISTFGYSQQGRAMQAYTFGSGGKAILFTGTIHGNELSAKYLMEAWIRELDANTVPSGRRIVVVPVINPDGVAAGSRYNSRGVDLNRNYDTSDWEKNVETVNGDPKPGGGGKSPGSEKETKAMMALTQQLQPALTMSYHSSAAYAIGNTCGDSRSLAAKYSELTGYRNMTGVSGAFSYQITGTYDDWICERLGLASVLVELATSYDAEFGRNQAALWAMARS